jgi:D-alanine transaminase
LTPTLVMTFKPLPAVPDDLRSRGARIITVPDPRWSKCHVKAITLLPNVLARAEANRRGYDDVVFVSAAGEVRECTSANVFIVRDGALKFPPRDTSVLHGITQRFLLACAASVDIAVQEAPFDVDALRSADEVFMSSTTVEVLAITSIDDRPVGDGRVGPVTTRMHDAFVQRARGQTVRP